MSSYDLGTYFFIILLLGLIFLVQITSYIFRIIHDRAVVKSIVEQVIEDEFWIRFQLYYRYFVNDKKTIYLSVDALSEGIDIPKEYVKDGEILFDISPQAIYHFVYKGDVVEFFAKFSGKTHKVILAKVSLLEVFAKENGMGFTFKNR